MKNILLSIGAMATFGMLLMAGSAHATSSASFDLGAENTGGGGGAQNTGALGSWHVTVIQDAVDKARFEVMVHSNVNGTLDVKDLVVEFTNGAAGSGIQGINKDFVDNSGIHHFGAGGQNAATYGDVVGPGGSSAWTADTTGAAPNLQDPPGPQFPRTTFNFKTVQLHANGDNTFVGFVELSSLNANYVKIAAQDGPGLNHFTNTWYGAAAITPELSSLGLLLPGMLPLAFLRRRRRSNQEQA